MATPTYVSLVVEDSLSEAVARRLLTDAPLMFEPHKTFGLHGIGYIRKNIAKFNAAARSYPGLYLVLADLDSKECAPSLLEDWLPAAREPNLILRIAVREIESWVMADRAGLARFLGIGRSVFPRDADALPDPKRTLIQLAARTRKRNLREAIVPPPGSTRVQGPDYNGALVPFVRKRWNPIAAAENSDSLRRAISALDEFSSSRRSQ